MYSCIIVKNKKDLRLVFECLIFNRPYNTEQAKSMLINRICELIKIHHEVYVVVKREDRIVKFINYIYKEADGREGTIKRYIYSDYKAVIVFDNPQLYLESNRA